MGGGDASVTSNSSDGGDNKKNNNETVEVSGGGDEVTVNIRCSNGSKFSVKVSLESTVGSFKSVLAQNCEIPAEQQRLIYKGRILKDDQTLQSYGIWIDRLIYLLYIYVCCFFFSV